jgi:hypothetical protein
MEALMHSPLLTTELFTLANILALTSGLCWLAVYVVALREGFKRQTYLIPMEALALNVVWEFIFGFIWAPIDPILNGQAWVNLFWCCLDVGIVYTVFKWATLPNVEQEKVRTYFLGTLLAAGGVLGSAYYVAANMPLHADLAIIEVQAVSSFLMNVLMSCLFIRMFWQGVGYSNKLVAWLKMSGTLAVSITYFISVGADTHYYPIIWACGPLCLLLDCFYLWLLYGDGR